MSPSAGETLETAGPSGASVDPDEIARFSAIADEWWDPSGKFAPLHRLNPVRLRYIRDAIAARFGRDPLSRQPLKGLEILDIGSGGGLICEPMARLGAAVTGIDAAARNVGVAAAHAAAGGLDIDYRHATAEDLAAAGATYDVVLALEIVEHVADVDAFVAACTALVAPGGIMIWSTINRTPKAFAFGIVGAEYVLRWLPRGTHQWRKFLRPSELARALRGAGAEVTHLQGMSYDLLTDGWRLTADLSVNYLATAIPAARE